MSKNCLRIENAFSKNERNQNNKSDSQNPDENYFDTTESNQYSIKCKGINNHLIKNQSAAKLMPPPSPLSTLKYNKTLDYSSFDLLESENIDITKQCNLFVYSKCRELLLDEFFQSNSYF